MATFVAVLCICLLFLLNVATAGPVLESDNLLEDSTIAPRSELPIAEEKFMKNPIETVLQSPMTCPAAAFEDKEKEETFIYVDAASHELASSEEPETLTIS